ncbi:hypothetical protein ACFQAT_04005 [Undibacterium arcticum]|uniref:Uncharacterized protein n=1 Tax=Undibacterium arcticum TaxID=1762892 RepID=A0ABV7F8B5_9BURK
MTLGNPNRFAIFREMRCFERKKWQRWKAIEVDWELFRLTIENGDLIAATKTWPQYADLVSD